MKYKLDFVTNSSSTSVVLWGVHLDESEIRENEILMTKIKELVGKKDQSKDLEFYEIQDAMGNLLTLDTHRSYNNGSLYIGWSPFSMHEDETLKHFKEKLGEELQKIGINNKIGQIIESWMDN